VYINLLLWWQFNTLKQAQEWHSEQIEILYERLTEIAKLIANQSIRTGDQIPGDGRSRN
jgi:hypothetical protein